MQFLCRQKNVVVMLIVLTMLFSIGAFPVDAPVLAVSKAPITIKYGDTVMAEFSSEELKSMVDDSEIYSYSTYNSVPTFKDVDNVTGVAVEMLISEAGITVSGIDKHHIIKFISEDGMETTYTKEQLLGTRYYYPHGDDGTSNGYIGSDISKSEREPVPAIISLRSEDPYENRLFFGQIEPNEQTKPAWIRYMSIGGEIVVTTDFATKLNKVSFSPGTGMANKGTKINISHNLANNTNGSSKIYFTTGGAAPSLASDIYNYKTKDSILCRTISTPSTDKIFTVKAFAMKYGYIDSDINTAVYNGKPGTVKGVKAGLAKYNAVKISWSALSGVDKYYVYYSTSKNGTYKKIATKSASVKTCTHSSLKTGKVYYYKVAAVKNGLIGNSSSAVSAKPVPSKPTGFKAKATGKRKILLTAKKVTGASGYIVYRSTKKSSGFKAIKTFKKSTLKYTDKKVKKGKKYYYKIKAYRKVGSTKVLSPFSVVVYKKAL